MLKQEYKIQVTEKHTIFAVVEAENRVEAEKIIKGELNFDVTPPHHNCLKDIDIIAKRIDEREVLSIEAEK